MSIWASFFSEDGNITHRIRVFWLAKLARHVSLSETINSISSLRNKPQKVQPTAFHKITEVKDTTLIAGVLVNRVINSIAN